MSWRKRNNRGIAFCFLAIVAAFSLTTAVVAQNPPPGDEDGNGVVDDNDRNIWLGGPNATDANGDGNIDFADFDQVFGIAPPPPGDDPNQPPPGDGGPPPGDLDGNGFVDDADLNIWLGGPDAADLDGNGVTDKFDFEAFFGIGPPPGDDPNQPPPGDGGPPPGDLDGNGFIDDNDRNIWIGGPDGFDANGDGTIDFADFDQVHGGPPPGDDPNQPPPGDDGHMGPPPGDLDGNGFIDDNDRNIWIGGPDGFDANGDGTIDFADFDQVHGGPGDGGFPPGDGGPPPGDLDGNGFVDDADVSIWMAGDSATDLNGDGFVDKADFDIAFSADNPNPDVPFVFGDFDGNGFIDDNDVALWQNEPEASDLNGDGQIDRADFDIFFAPPGDPGVEGEWIFGTVTFVDPTGSGFDLEKEDGTIENVVLTSATEVVLILPVDPDGPPPTDGSFKRTVLAQEGDPFFNPPVGSVADIQVGTFMNVFGSRLESGQLEAIKIEVFVDGPDGGDGFPGLPPELVNVLEEIKSILEGDNPPTFVDVAPYLANLPDDLQAELLSLAGDDGQLDLQEAASFFGPPMLSPFLIDLVNEIKQHLESSGDFSVPVSLYLDRIDNPGDADLFTRLGGDNGEITLSDVFLALDGNFDFFPDPSTGGPPPLSAGFQAMLAAMRAQLEGLPAGATLRIEDFFSDIAEDEHPLLVALGGTNGEFTLDDVVAALEGRFDFGPGGPGPGGPPPGGETPISGTFAGGILSVNLDIPGLGPVIVNLQMSDDGNNLDGDVQGPLGPVLVNLIRTSGTGADNVNGDWEGDIIGQRLFAFFEQDGEVVNGSAILDGGDGGGGGPDGPPVAEGIVTNVNHDDFTFEIEQGDGQIRKVIVTEDTRVSVQGGGDPTGFPGGDFGDGFGGDGFGGDGGGFSTFGQFDDPNQPPPPAGFDGDFTDIQAGLFVVVFGTEQDNGDIVADFIEVFRDDFGGPGGPGGILGAFEQIIRQILSDLGSIGLDDPALSDVSQEIRDLLADAAGDDGVLSLNELDDLLGFQPDGPDFGEPLFEGEVVAINRDANTFDVLLSDGVVETVQVTDETEFAIRLQGAPGFGPQPPPGDDGFGPQPPPGDDGGGFSTFGQFDGPGGGSDFIGGDQFEGIAFFADMQEGDFVEVFGDEHDDGTIVAIGVKIIRDFDGDGGGGFGDFPVAFGRVIHIDIDNSLFEIEEAPGLRNTVTVTETTVFEIETFSFFGGPPPIDGGGFPVVKPAARKVTRRTQFDDTDGFGDFQPPDIRTATFGELRIDDDCDIFGEFNADGTITATRVKVFRGAEPPEPDLFGVIVDLDFDARTITIEGDDEVPTTIQLTDDTFVGLFHGNFGDDEPPLTGPEPPFPGDDGTLVPVTKQADGDFVEPPPGVIFDEFRRFEDIVISMQVAVYLVDAEASDLVASAVIILNGGARQRGFEFAQQIDFVDRFGGLLFFRPPFGVDVPEGTPITLASGDVVTSLRELREALSQVQTFRFEPRFLRIFADDSADPDIKIATEIIVVPLGEDLFQGSETILARIDNVFDQLVDRENRIWPSPPPPVRFNRKTHFADVNGDPVELRDLFPGTRVAVEGIEVIFPGGFEGERLAEFVTIIGGEPFEFEGIVASVDETANTFSLEIPAAEPILARARFSGFQGGAVSPEEFLAQLGSRQGVEILVQFNPLGPGIVGLALSDPENPRLFPPDVDVFQDFEVDIVGDNGEFQLVFNPLPDFQLGENVVLLDRAGSDIALADLVGKQIFIEGEIVGGQPLVFFAKAFEAIDAVELAIEIGDFDDEGAENDVILRVFDGAGNEIEENVNVFLDFLPPVSVRSGAVAFNQTPGVHRVEVEVPSLGLFAEQEFVIRGRGKGFGVASVVPEDEATGVPEQTEIRVAFTAPVQKIGRFVNAVAFLRPGFQGKPLKNLRLEDDGLTLVIPVELQANTSYTLTIASAVSRSDQALNEPVVVTFSTGDELLSFGRITGSIALVEALTKQADDGSEILFGEVLVFDEEDEQVAKGVVTDAGTFGIGGLPEGDYLLFAKVETTTGNTSGGFDSDGDGEPDPVRVVGGETTDLGAFALPRPLTASEASIVSDLTSPITIDFNASGGDDGQDTNTVPPGEMFEVAVYVKGVTDLVGYNIQVDFDSTAVTLESIADDGATELNILKLRGGVAVSITTPRGDAISQATAMLGGTTSQWAQGDGLLSVLTFTVNERFSGDTDITVTQAQLSNGAGGTETLQVFTRGTVTVEGLSKQLALTASPDSIAADGSAASTITAALSDLDGLALTDDNASEVTFSVTGDGLVDGEVSKTVTATNGSASVVLTAQAEGPIVVTATTSGARLDTVTVVGTGLAPVGEGEIGPMALDFNTEAGDQEERILAEIPETGVVTLDLVLTAGGTPLSGFQASVAYDPTVLSYVSANPTGLFAGGAAIPTESTGLVRISTVFLGSTTTTGDAGSIATLTFQVAEGATLPTRVTLSSGTIAAEDGTQTRLTLGPGGSVVQVGGEGGGPPTPDFDGDGLIGFTDFIQFAAEFGKTSASADFDSKFDLDEDGSIGFTDFIQFAGLFGTAVKPALTKSAGLGNVNAGVTLSATPVKGSPMVDVAIGLTDVSTVAGYHVRFGFDQALLELVSVQSPVSSFSTDHAPAIQLAGAGETTAADVLVDPIQGDGDLLTMRFRVLDPTALTSVELLGVDLADVAGRITEIRPSEVAEFRSLPDRFELRQNYPNPFNPETVIPFSVPESGILRLSIFNVLGQEVAVLVDGDVQAGFHRIVWDGKDHFGRSVASGLYFVRMHADAFTSVRKMMFLK